MKLLRSNNSYQTPRRSVIFYEQTFQTAILPGIIVANTSRYVRGLTT
jgi:hypothetical protein